MAPTCRRPTRRGGSGTGPPRRRRMRDPRTAGWRSRRATPPTRSIGRAPGASWTPSAGRLGDLYDECLAGLDAELGRFLGDLRDRGLLADTWVVITADHGEHFGEHGHFGHGSSLYNELTHVPLILVPPLGTGRSADDPYASLRGRRVGVPVSLRDLPRTMTGLLLPARANPFPGRSLARHWRTDHTSRPIPSSPSWRSRASKGKTSAPTRSTGSSPSSTRITS